MAYKLINPLATFASEAGHFFVPKKDNALLENVSSKKRTAVLIPTHVPDDSTYKLIKSIIEFHPSILIVVIDDFTPLNKQTSAVINKIKKLASLHEQLVYLRTPTNTLKAGALNYGLDYLAAEVKPQVVFTLDDDVRITKDTLPLMINALYANKEIGAVCSQVRVKNKNKNLLTRLQGLEYHNFNVTKISDNGFLKGPLVMQGMLTGFRMTTLKQIGGYTDGHLIEDYDITARLKARGWKVKVEQNAIAWTNAPETLEGLWKQRVRWTFGGLRVLQEFWGKVDIIYQDLIGHGLFLSLLLLVGLSFTFAGAKSQNPSATIALFMIALLNFLIAFTFNLYTLTRYADRDKKDILLRASVIPEFIYTNVLNIILIGSYLFFLYNLITKAFQKETTLFNRPYRLGLSAFNKVGFSTTWGTRQLKTKRGGLNL
jgi:cellulose synthase/poly-beta-1,6-N-acetylglucosamine synthase-like glycosyltransferase